MVEVEVNVMGSRLVSGDQSFFKRFFHGLLVSFLVDKVDEPNLVIYPDLLSEMVSECRGLMGLGRKRRRGGFH